jgi:8-oxo-dGTP pyrophosphatase MutT (NUDIX family)
MEQTLYANGFLSLKKKGDYIYAHESRSDGKLVAILVYDSSRPNLVLGRYEICPAHDDPVPQLCAITGGIDIGHAPIEAAIEELREEAGYVAEPTELESLGEIRPSKSADTAYGL